MPMIDVGIKIEMSTAAGEVKPVAAWRELKNCTAMPALIQPSSKIATDFIGDQYTGEMLGKRAITGLDFTFAFDGSAEGSQFRFLSDADDNNEKHFLRVTYPDGTKFELLVECEVTLVAPAPSAEIDYTLSVTPVRTDKLSDLIEIIYVGETDPLQGI
nr:MAG TPA: tail tube protein [Caudoviricetes sp.]